MIYHQIADLIRHQPEKIAQSWCEHIKQADVTRSYHDVSVEELLARHIRVFENLAKWLEPSLSRAELGDFFFELGKQRFREGVPLPELNYALLVAKRDFWNLVQSQGLLNSSLEFYQAMELMSSVDQFFDLGNYHMIRGYLDGLYHRLGPTEDREKLRHLLADDVATSARATHSHR